MADFQRERLAHAMLGPRQGKLLPEDEAGFQSYVAFDPGVRSWRNGFASEYGEQPRLDDPGFDYRKAFMAGQGPVPIASDTVPHWGSAGKAPDHPTSWMSDFMQTHGTDPLAQAQAGFTPDQSKMVNDQLTRDMLTRLLSRFD